MLITVNKKAMKTKIKKAKLSLWLLVLMLVAAVGLTANAQPCEKVEIAADLAKRTILQKFISESRQINYFIHTMGIVELRIFTDKEGRNCWLLFPRIDDRYKDNPPTQYATFDHDIILIYQANDSGMALQTKGDTAALNRCLEDIIGDRVYIRPKKGRLVEVIDIDGKLKRVQSRTITGGSIGEIQVVFNKDGTYKTFSFL